MSNTTISYSGSVTRSVYKKGKLKYTENMHNEGLYPLFYAICNFLIGRGQDDRTPYYLDLCTKEIKEDKTIYKSVLTREPIFQSKVTENYSSESENTSAGCKASFVAYMYKENVKDKTEADANKELYYVMRSQGTQSGNQLALAVVDSKYAWKDYKIAEDETWVINWVMELRDISANQQETSGGSN